MAESTTKRPKSTIVRQEMVDKTGAFLEDLPEKPRDELSLREAVNRLQDSIKTALAKGYTYQEIAEMLTEQGIKISAFTLKNYVPAGRRQAAKKTRRGRKPAIDSLVVDVASINGATTDEPEAPKSTRGRKAVAKTGLSEEVTVSRGRRSASSTAAKSTTTAKTTPGRRGRKPRSAE
jgi:hypothetical protein